METFEEFYYGITKQLNESDSPLLQILSDKFGKDIVFSKEENYMVSEQDMLDCYSIVNEIAFDDKLDKLVPIYVVKSIADDDESGDASKSRKTLAMASMSYVEDEVGMFVVDQFYILISEFSNNFFTILCALVHEMIHCYIAKYDGKLDFAKKAWITAHGQLERLKKINDHGPHFVNKMNELNSKFDLDIKVARTNTDINFPVDEDIAPYKRYYEEVKDKITIKAKEKLSPTMYKGMLIRAVEWCYVHSAGSAVINGNTQRLIVSIE